MCLNPIKTGPFWSLLRLLSHCAQLHLHKMANYSGTCIYDWSIAVANLQVPVHYFTRENLLCHLKIRKISTFSLLHNFCLCPFFSSNMSLSMFWLLRRSLTTILQRIYEWRKESCWVVSNLPAKCVFKHFRQIKG